MIRQKKHVKLKGHRTALLTFLLLIGTLIQAQTTVEFETGLLKYTPGVKMYNLTDSYVAIHNIRFTGGTEFVGADLLLVNKQTLAIDDTIFSWNIANSDFKGGFVEFYKDSQGNNYFVQFGRTVDSTELILNYYSLTSDYAIDALLVTKKWSNKDYHRLGFVNDELIIIYTAPYPRIDSLYIETFNTSGTMLQSRFYNYSDSTKNQVFVSGFNFIEINPYPLSKAFVLSNMIGTKIFVVNQNTLDTIITYDAEWYGPFPANSNLINTYGYAEMVNRKVRVENDGVVLTGTVLTKPYYLSNNDLSTSDDQFFRMKQYWDRTYEIQDFGPIDINNGACFGYGINETTQTQVIAGSIPFDNSRFNAQEKREVLIYIYDRWGKYDSVFIHGDKNHVCRDLIVEDNGDIFIAGTYTDAWTTDSSYNWLTKIPQIAVGMIEQEKINNHLFLFPNPTVETIQIKEVSKFVNGEYQIYSQSGILVKQGRVTGQEIEVSSFTAGVYVLTVKSQNEEQFNAIFVKE